MLCPSKSLSRRRVLSFRINNVNDLLRFLLLFCCLAASAHADPVTLPARAVSYRPEMHGWARVEVVAPLTLRMPLAARVLKVAAVPGQSVTAGESLVWLGGPHLAGERAAARARVAAAAQELEAARQSAASVERTYPALANRQALAAARAAVAAARGRLAETLAAQRALSAQAVLASPLPAVVEKVESATAVDLPAGAPLVTLLPQAQLWLRAELFSAAPPIGSTARFVPADGAAATVHLAGELPARAANGARVLNFTLPSGPQWQAGQSGRLVIEGAPEPAVAVPAGALILDAGHWYVLTERTGKLLPQAVTPGPTRGDYVLILHGLAPGTPVVVRQAYALYHRDFAAHYTPPD